MLAQMQNNSVRGLARRQFILTAAAAASRPMEHARLIVPVHRVMNSRARCTRDQLRDFWWHTWPEAVRDFNGGGIQLQTSDAAGEVRRSPGDRPIFTGLRRDCINLVLTDYIPMKWNPGAVSAGVTTIYDGYHLCVLALRYAHGNQVPFLSVNTCVHELLHALLLDVFVRRPTWYQSGGREFRIDWYATRLWLFHDGAAIRQSAQAYLARLRSAATATPTTESAHP